MTRIHWLDWTQPCLPQAAAWLLEGLRQGDRFDGRGTVCVLPGGRAGRLLLAELAHRCKAADLPLIPPTTVTPGVMAQVLLAGGEPVATPLEVRLAWATALRSMPVDAIRSLLPAPPGPEDLPAWHRLADMLARLRQEFAGEGLTFDDAARHAAQLDLSGEVDRWRAIATVHEAVLRSLRDAGLVDSLDSCWQQIRQDRRAAGVHRVVLIGVDLNAMQRQMLALFGERCTALVHAPSELAHRFDADGCVIAEQWANATIDLDDDRIIVADRPEDQAQAMLLSLAQLNGQYAPDEITIGLGDEHLAASLQRGGKWANITLHHAAGHALERSGPAQFLAAVADWLDEPRFATFAALLRHPDVERRLMQTVRAKAAHTAAEQDWLTLLDTYFTDHLAGRLTDSWLGSEATRAPMKAVHAAVTGLIAPLAADRKPLADWCEPILELLSALIKEGADDNHRSLDACVAIRDTLAEMSKTHRRLQPVVGGADALRVLLAEMEGQTLPRSLEAGAIEALGWLELHLDTAPALIITGVNDGLIPQNVPNDGFLPDSMRRALGLADNCRRYARDAYLLIASLKSRPHVTLICGRVNADGEPLAPSRLLMACDDPTLPRRVRRLCDAESALRWPLPTGLGSPAPRTAFTVPRPPQGPMPLQSMRVTDFAAYLACPYRFWLGRLLNLEAMEDRAGELDPLRFGSLAHDVLQTFAEQPAVRDSIDEDQIARFLVDTLHNEATRRFGRSIRPAIRVQVAQLESRLRGLARWQAAARQQGWIVQHAELKFDEHNLLDIPGSDPLALRGKIDRVDRHEATGAWRIIDYKTGESAKSPHYVHHGRESVAEEWLDLQLPLYHFLARQRGWDEPIELGYVVLPRDAQGVDFLRAQWTVQDLERALDRARRIVREIREGRFEINGEFSSEFDDFARICQTTAFARATAGDEREGDE